jgi:hypothetical protein
MLGPTLAFSLKGKARDGTSNATAPPNVCPHDKLVAENKSTPAAPGDARFCISMIVRRCKPHRSLSADALPIAGLSTFF